AVDVLTYRLPVRLAGKMLAVLERPYRPPRDLYDRFWLLSRGVEEDARYLRTAATMARTRKLVRERAALYGALADATGEYAEAHIRTELGALLPQGQRRWASSALPERTRELLRLRLASL